MNWLFNGSINQKQTPAFYASSLATRPAAGYVGRLFIDTDTPSTGIYRDTGAAWVAIADPGAGTTGTLQQVTTNGNSTAQGIAVSAKGIGIGTTIPNTNRIDIHSASGVQASLNGTTTTNAGLQLQNAGVAKWRVRNNYNSGANDFGVYDETNAIDRINITNAGVVSITGVTNTSGSLNVAGATNNVSYQLNVNGAANFSGTVNGVASFWTGESAMGYNNAVTFGGFPFRFKIARDSAGDLPVYFDDEYDNALSSINFRMRTTGAINTPLTIKFNNILTNVRLNVNGATDNASYQLNVTGNTFTSGTGYIVGLLTVGGGIYSTNKISIGNSNQTAATAYFQSNDAGIPVIRAQAISSEEIWNGRDSAGTLTSRIAADGSAILGGTLGINGTADNVKGATYTPTVALVSGTLTNIVVGVCRYVRIGNFVRVSGALQFDSPGGTNDHVVSITLPFSTLIGTSLGTGVGNGIIFGGVSTITACQIVQTTSSKFNATIKTFSAQTSDGILFTLDYQIV